jgi:hypothetical protein
MYVYDESNTCFCFGRCWKTYDTIEIVRALENKEFEDAVMFLSNVFAPKIMRKFGQKKKLGLNLYIKLNEELKWIFDSIKEDKEKRIRVVKIMQIIDLQPTNNLLILKLYQSLLREIK